MGMDILSIHRESKDSAFDMEEEEIGHYFPEIFKVSMIVNMVTVHIGMRPGCAVRECEVRHLIK